MAVRRAVELTCVVLLALVLIAGINFVIAVLITPRFSIGGPFGPPVSVNTWYEFVGRPRPEEPAVIIKFMLIGEPTRPSRAILKIENYMKYGIDVEVRIYIYGPDVRLLASGVRHLSVKSRGEAEGEVSIVWAEGSLKEARWGRLHAEVVGHVDFLGLHSSSRAMALAMSSATAARIRAYDGNAKTA